MKHNVTIRREDFVAALKPVGKLVRPDRSGQEALVYMEGNNLTFSLRGVAVSMAAEGTWPGEVKIALNSALTLAKSPPRGDPLAIQVVDGRFRVGTFSIPCSFQKTWRSEIELSMDAELPDILALAFKYSSEELELAGYAKTLADAQTKLDKLVKRAAKSLTPLRITERELSDLLNEWIRMRSSDSPTDRSKE